MSGHLPFRDLGTATMPAMPPRPPRPAPPVVVDPIGRDLKTAEPLPRVMRPHPPAPPLMRVRGRGQPWALKSQVKSVESIANGIKARLDALAPISTVEPDTVNKILARQNNIVDNMNALRGQ